MMFVMPHFFKSSQKLLSDLLLYSLVNTVLGSTFLILILTSIPVCIFRIFVILLAKWVRPDLGKCMEGMTNASYVTDWFSGKPPRSTIAGRVIFSGNLTKEDLEEAVMRRWIQGKREDQQAILEYPQFQQYPYRWLGFTFWKFDKDFKIANHVFSHNLSGNGPTSDDQDLFLDTLHEKLMNEIYHPDRSPWELHLVNNYINPKFEDGPLSVVVWKMHHTLGDGFSILGSLVDGLGEIPLESLKLPTPHGQNQEKTFAEIVLYVLTFPNKCMLEFWKFIREINKSSPWLIPDSNKKWYQYVAHSELIPIDKIRQIKDFYGVNFSAVLISAISTAITDHFFAKNCSKNKNEFTQSILFGTIMPVARNYKKERLTNRMTLAFFPIPTSSDYPPPVERLYKCNQIVEATRSSVIPTCALILISTIGAHFTRIAAFLLRNRFLSVVLTNVYSVPSDCDCEIAGKQVLFADAIVGGMQGPVGVVFQTMSCRSYLKLAVATEMAVMSREDAKKLVNGAEEAINTLYNLIDYSSYVNQAFVLE